MNAQEFLEWLKENNLLDIAKENAVHVKHVLKDCLAIKDEDLLIIGDTGSEKGPAAPILAGAYYFAAKELGITTGVAIQTAKSRGEYAEPHVIDALQNLNRRNVIVMALSTKPGKLKDLGNSFRSFCYENYHRFASAVSLGSLTIEQIPSLMHTMNTDYEKMKLRGDMIKTILDSGKEIRIKTPAGTDLTVGIEGKKAVINNGCYQKPKTGGNIPAGEVYIAPKMKNVNGTIVIDGSSAYRDGTQLITEPIKLIVENGEIKNIEGKEEADKLSETLEWAHKKAKYPWGIRRIGEIGIGINPNASIAGATIIDEKSLGTCHVGIGSNYWFGGTIYAIIHLDQILKNPKIYVDNELIDIE